MMVLRLLLASFALMLFPSAALAEAARPFAIADLIAREVVARSDFLMDVHSGDGAEFLDAFVGASGGSR
jgi:predicted deacylase